jgi:nitrate reductase assembly molybdenum cofactor insertion protein NarJ
MNRLFMASVLALLLSVPALADDAADCAAGIETIKAEIAKAPAKETLDKLTKLLHDAEREAGEKEFEECFEAIEDAEVLVGG